jgi:hypothetical protein
MSRRLEMKDNHSRKTVEMRQPTDEMCVSMRDAPILRTKEDMIKRRFILTIFFDRPDKSEDFESSDLSTILTNAFDHWHSPTDWSELNIAEIDRDDKLAKIDSLELINELQKRKVRMKVDDEMYQVIVIPP